MLSLCLGGVSGAVVWGLLCGRILSIFFEMAAILARKIAKILFLCRKKMAAVLEKRKWRVRNSISNSFSLWVVFSCQSGAKL